jgi:hypothetical protein
MKSHLAFGVLAYLVLTFAPGVVWHLILFKHYKEAFCIA